MITFFSNFKYYFSKDRVLFIRIKQITGIAPLNLSCYKQSLRHHSIASKIHNSGSKDSNERLEFLGDAVLNSVIAEYLFKKYPYKDEGFLTELRSKIVSRVSLNDLALRIGLSELVEYDRKSMQNINVRNSIFGNALEAFIGAIFLDKGFKKSKYFIIEKLLRLHIDVDKLQQTEKNFKGRLIEYTQKSGMNLDFNVDELAHGKQKIFKVSVIVNKKVFGEAEHTNKKQAEQQASEKAIELLKNTPKDFFTHQEKIENRDEEVLVEEVIEETLTETINESNDRLKNEDLKDSLSEETESEDLLAETEVNFEIDAESIHLNKVLDGQTEEVKTNN
ncbi:MAG: ribonuclease III [Bacteroidia bacterium]